MTQDPADSFTLPNLITLGRIAVCPAIFWLAISPDLAARAAAFALFLAAALSDLWDGYLARKHGWVTDMGKLLDPLADKLLMVASLVPIYIVSHRPGVLNDVPWWGPLPFWILAVIFGREILITLFRSWAQRRGVVIAAGKSGKYKALFQAFFAGGALLWYPVQQWALGAGWTGQIWSTWSTVHRGWVGATLALAILLTIYSMLDYLWSYRGLLGLRD